MKLQQLRETEDLQAYANEIYRYVGQYVRSPKFRAAARNLIAIPKYQYTGSMYRVAVIGPEPFRKGVRPEQLLDTAKRHKPGQLLSWSKTLEGMAFAMYTNENAGLYDHLDDTVGVIFEQTGTALDIEPLLEDFEPPEGFVMDIPTLREEQEILADTQTSLRIHGYWAGVFTNVKDYDKFVQQYIQRT